MNKIGLIVEREFTERVRKKSFIISTLLTPLFMIAMMVLPSVLMLKGNSDTKNVVVINFSLDTNFDTISLFLKGYDMQDAIFHVDTHYSFDTILDTYLVIPSVLN